MDLGFDTEERIKSLSPSSRLKARANVALDSILTLGGVNTSRSEALRRSTAEILGAVVEFKGVLMPGCGGEIDSVLVAKTPDTEMTIDDLTTAGVKVLPLEVDILENMWIRNVYSWGWNDNGESVLVDSLGVDQTYNRPYRRYRGGIEELGIKREVLWEPCDFGNILVLGENAVVSKGQVLSLLGKRGSYTPSLKEEGDVMDYFRQHLGIKSTVLVGRYDVPTHPSLYDIDLIITPVSDGEIIFSMPIVGKDVPDRENFLGQISLIREQLEDSGIKIVGEVPYRVHKSDRDASIKSSIFSYNNCLIDSRRCFVPVYRGFDKFNDEAMRSWKQIGKRQELEIIPIRILEYSRMGQGGLRCMTVESRKKKSLSS